MNKKEIMTAGFERGYDVAKNIDLFDIGDYVDGYILGKGNRIMVTVDNWMDIHINLAGIAEDNGRSYSPFEFLAGELNEMSDKKSYDVWSVFEESVLKGELKALKERLRLLK
jgi:hypothetical protein